MIPAWDDSKAYPSVEAPMIQWAWEFLRRNPEYQKAWEQYKNTGVSPGRDSLWNKFGVINLCDPQKDFGSREVTLLCLRESTPLSYITWFSMRHLKKDGPDDAMDAAELIQATQPQTPYEVVIKFDVQNDIQSQLNEAEEYLVTVRKLFPEATKEFSPVSPRPEKLLIYLRLLDAETQLLPKSDSQLAMRVAKTLAPDKDEYIAADSFRKNLKVARYWRDIGYKTLALAKYRLLPTKEEAKEIERWVAEYLDDMVALNMPEK